MLLLVGLLAASTVVGSLADEIAQSEELNDFEALKARKRELMKLVDELEGKLPKDLQRRLMIISMKIYTGYCSPRIIKEFEDAVNALPEHELKRFKNEWRRMCEHSEWPDTGMLRKPSPKDNAPGREGSRNP